MNSWIEEKYVYKYYYINILCELFYSIYSTVYSLLYCQCHFDSDSVRVLLHSIIVSHGSDSLTHSIRSSANPNSFTHRLGQLSWKITAITPLPPLWWFSCYCRSDVYMWRLTHNSFRWKLENKNGWRSTCFFSLEIFFKSIMLKEEKYKTENMFTYYVIFIIFFSFLLLFVFHRIMCWSLCFQFSFNQSECVPENMSIVRILCNCMCQPASESTSQSDSRSARYIEQIYQCHIHYYQNNQKFLWSNSYERDVTSLELC